VVIFVGEILGNLENRWWRSRNLLNYTLDLSTVVSLEIKST